MVAVILTESDHPSYDDLVVDRVAGVEGDSLLGVRLPAASLVSQCLESRRPQLVDDIGDQLHPHILPRASLGPAMAVPLPAEQGTRGCLFVLRDQGSHSFTEFELDVAASLAGHAALALDYADAREARARSITLEDRVRIARDLHDHVVQRLFATGLHIQSIASTLSGRPAGYRLNEQVEEIDATIRQIRSTIFGLNVKPARSASVRARIIDVIKAATVTLPGPPEVTFRGPVDLLVSEALCEDLSAVVREALTNVGRHAAAQRVELHLAADAHAVSVEVLDDGKGLAQGVELSGLANLRARAERLGGSFRVGSREGPGTCLRWSVPLEPAA
jgi:signal transduction histidine kinase